MLDSDGHTIEGVMSNMFILKDGVLKTPDLSQCGVHGVMRGLVLEIAADLDIPASVETFSLEQIWQADAVFLCNSLIGIWPVRGIEDKDYSVEAIPPALIDAVMQQGFTP